MSLPKEPRQLMINLMYLVLTAMLALNVSAEILNAFLTMDKSIGESSRIVGDSNDQLFTAIEQQADAYSQYEPFKLKAAEAQLMTKEFYDYIENLKQELIEVSGGLDEKNEPIGKKRKEPTTHLFVNEGKGDELEQKIIQVRENLLNLVEEESKKTFLDQVLPLELQPIPENSDKKSWGQFTFQQMPVAAALPILSKFQNDVKIAESALLTYFFNKTGTDMVKPDAFAAVVSADKSYVIKGEELSAEIFLSAFSTTADNISIKVNGRPLEVKDGKALLNIRPNEIGNKSFEAVVELTNPLTGEIQTYKKRFDYIVGERSVAASADKMNVFYLGVDNPFSVSAAGVPTGEVKVNGENVNLQKIKNGKYIIRPKKKGTAKIVVSGGGLEPTTFEYRVKRIPDPVIRLGTRHKTLMTAAEFKAYQGIVPVLDNFDFKARCNVVSFELTRLPKNNSPDFAKNKGGKYKTAARRLVDQARPGDTFYFDDVRVRCPGDEITRKLNGLSIKIK